MEFLDFPSMSCELRGAMSNGHLKLTDEKIVFQHAKSGKKDSVKVMRAMHDTNYLFCNFLNC
jgi:hypothetical protein